MTSVTDNDRVSLYVRSSTDRQEDDHQWESIQQWRDEHAVDDGQVETYADVGSGASLTDRDEFNDLLDTVEAGETDHVVAWEISRLSRDGETLQRFFNAAEANDIVVWITDGAVERVTPDGQGRFVADIIGMVYQQERRSLIRRVEAGVERARREGKWLGRVPAGFTRTENGRLRPILDPDDDEDSFLEIKAALEAVEDGDSYRSEAKTLNITRQGLSGIDKDDERRQWYLDRDAADARVDEALWEVRKDP